VKPGWRTTEFWMSLLTSILGVVTLFGGHATAGSILATGATVAYSVSRGLAKQTLEAAPVEITRVPVPPMLPVRSVTPLPPK